MIEITSILKNNLHGNMFFHILERLWVPNPSLPRFNMKLMTYDQTVYRWKITGNIAVREKRTEN
jgi:hypothetical protein